MSSDETNSFICKFCTKTYSRRFTLNRHLRTNNRCSLKFIEDEKKRAEVIKPMIEPPIIPEPVLEEAPIFSDDAIRYIMMLKQQHARELDIIRRDHKMEIDSLKSKIKNTLYSTQQLHEKYNSLDEYIKDTWKPTFKISTDYMKIVDDFCKSCLKCDSNQKKYIEVTNHDRGTIKYILNDLTVVKDIECIELSRTLYDIVKERYITLIDDYCINPPDSCPDTISNTCLHASKTREKFSLINRRTLFRTIIKYLK